MLMILGSEIHIIIKNLKIKQKDAAGPMNFTLLYIDSDLDDVSVIAAK